MSGMMSLKPEQKRRLGAEQAIYRKFNNFRDCADACNVLAEKKGVDITFNRLSIQQFVGCQTNLSMKRLTILAELLGITNYRELNEIFVAPRNRGCGDWWLSEDSGNRVKDIDMSMVNRFSN